MVRCNCREPAHLQMDVNMVVETFVVVVLAVWAAWGRVCGARC